MKLNRRNYSSEDGFTLIELLIAAVLIVFGLLAFGVFSGNLVVQNTKSERKTQASTYAQEKLEDLKNQALATDLATSSSSDSLDNGIYTRTWTIANGGSGNIATVTVMVEWKNSTGPGNSSISFQSLISQN